MSLQYIPFTVKSFLPCRAVGRGWSLETVARGPFVLSSCLKTCWEPVAAVCPLIGGCEGFFSLIVLFCVWRENSGIYITERRVVTQYGANTFE